MPFVNEFIPASDINAFGIKEIDEQVPLSGRTRSDSWTIDRQREMYLRCVYRGKEEFKRKSAWTFLWNKELLWVEIEILNASTDGRGKPGWSRKKINKIGVFRSEHAGLPPHLQLRRDEIIRDLREALHAYADGGVYSATTSYELTLEIGEGV